MNEPTETPKPQEEGGVASAAHGSAWISCDDQMPLDNEDCLVTDGNVATVARFSAGDWVESTCENDLWFHHVGGSSRWEPTHWRCLPSLPNTGAQATTPAPDQTTKET